jgi:hypothetical protein
VTALVCDTEALSSVIACQIPIDTIYTFNIQFGDIKWVILLRCAIIAQDEEEHGICHRCDMWQTRLQRVVEWCCTSMSRHPITIVNTLSSSILLYLHSVFLGAAGGMPCLGCKLTSESWLCYCWTRSEPRRAKEHPNMSVRQIIWNLWSRNNGVIEAPVQNWRETSQ